ncbi:MAG TPA: hypothetical protein VI456_12505, partial [Polyangia bacterium]
MALPEVETETFSARYQLTVADARSILGCFVAEWTPVLVGLALLVLLAASTSVFGVAGRWTPIVVPGLVAWRLLDIYNRTKRAIGPAKEITTTFDATGVRHETAVTTHAVRWAGFRRITRFKAGWIFSARAGGRF